MFFTPNRIPIHTVLVIYLFVADNTFAHSNMMDIEHFDTDNISKGVYSFREVESRLREEKGYLDDEGYMVVDGMYGYTDSDNILHFVWYHADKEGYRAREGPGKDPTGLLLGCDGCTWRVVCNKYNEAGACLQLMVDQWLSQYTAAFVGSTLG